MSLKKESYAIVNLLKKTGSEIRRIELEGDYNIELKADNSPVTLADYTSDSIISKGLKSLYPEIDIVSEETIAGKNINANKFWLLDPIDGTKEFIAGNGEYCISLALIESGYPIQGYIYAPYSDECWIAHKNKGAIKLQGKTELDISGIKQDSSNPLLLLRSRSHNTDEEESWYRKVSKGYKINIRQQGSAIKFCRIAEGSADLYIKMGSIYGWDIAAGDLILSECGGGLFSYPDGSSILYGSEVKKMPHFLACSNRIKYPLDWLV